MISSSAISHEEQAGAPPFNAEAAILRIGREDDPEALAGLYDATERAVYAYILSVILSPEDTADLVQETYLNVRRSAHLYAPTGKPMAWLLDIARKLTKDYLRVHRPPAIRFNSPETDRAFGGVKHAADRLILKHALGGLRSKDRQVLFLHAAAGLRYREISAYLVIPISTVKARYRRSIIKLKKRLSALGVSL